MAIYECYGENSGTTVQSIFLISLQEAAFLAILASHHVVFPSDKQKVRLFLFFLPTDVECMLHTLTPLIITC